MNSELTSNHKALHTQSNNNNKHEKMLQAIVCWNNLKKVSQRKRLDFWNWLLDLQNVALIFQAHFCTSLKLPV